MRRRLGPLVPLAVALPLCLSGCTVDPFGPGEQSSTSPETASTTTQLTKADLRTALLTPESLGTFKTVDDHGGRDLGLGCLDAFLIDAAQARRTEVTLAARSMFELPTVVHGIASFATAEEAKALMATLRAQTARCTKLPFPRGNPFRVKFAGSTVRTDLNADVDDEVDVVASTTSHFEVERGFYQGKAVDLPVTLRFVAARMGSQVFVIGVTTLGDEKRVEHMATMVANMAIARIRAVLRDTPPPTSSLDLRVTLVEDALEYVH